MSHAETSVRLLLTVLESDACDVAFEPEGAVVALHRGDAFNVEKYVAPARVSSRSATTQKG